MPARLPGFGWTKTDWCCPHLAGLLTSRVHMPPRPPQMRLEGPAPAQQPAAAAPAAQQAPPADDPKKKEEEERKKEAEKDLPEGWAVAFDAQKKPYFWHKQVGGAGA